MGEGVGFRPTVLIRLTNLGLHTNPATDLIELCKNESRVIDLLGLVIHFTRLTLQS